MMSRTVTLGIWQEAMLQTLTKSVQFWSTHHVHWTKLHPNHGERDLNSMDVISFEIYTYECCNLNSSISQNMLEIHLKNAVP